MKRLITLFLIGIGLAVSQVSVNAQFERQQSIPQPSAASLPQIRPPHIPQSYGGIPISREPKVLRKGILAPDAADVTQHQFLLSQKNTGLMRLLPRETFEWGIRRGDKPIDKMVPIRGGGAYFSFHHRSHEYGYGSDLSYEYGLLRVGFAGANYGMLTDLGDTPLEPITAKDPRAGFLLNYKPPQKEWEARIEAKRFEPIRTPHGLTGFTSEGVPYLRRVEAVLNHTYLLRSIDYRTSDVLVAFRIVRMSDDGGLTIAWKLLKEFGAPELILDKR